MSGKKRAVVYGLGQEYEKQKEFIYYKFIVVGVCDTYRTDVQKDRLEDALGREYDYIYITSTRYYSEIKEQVLGFIGKDNEKKIVSLRDFLADLKNSEVRDQWIIDQLAKIPKGKVLLDAGAGEQRYRSHCKHLQYISQDFSNYVPNQIKDGLQSESWDYAGIDIVCDIVDIPMDNASVDVILCTEVFEHIRNPILALEEFSRIIKTGGKLILSAPVCCLTHMAPYFYYNGFSEFWYQDNLKECGFQIVELVRNGNFFKYLCQELQRVEYMAKRYCTEQLDMEEIGALLKSVEILKCLSEKDNGSSEMLCFGNMLVAEKIVH